MSDGAVCLFALYSLQSSRRFTETVNNIISRDYYCHLSCFIHAGNLRWLIKIDENNVLVKICTYKYHYFHCYDDLFLINTA